MEPRIITVLAPPKTNDGKFNGKDRFTVYSIEGIAPCMHTCGGGNLEPKILLEMEEYRFNYKRVQQMIDDGKISGDKVQYVDAYNQSVNDDVASTITARVDDSNHLISEPVSCASRKRGDEHKIETRKDEVANCVTSIDTDSMVVEPQMIQKVGDRGTDNYSVKDISNTIPANPMSDRGQLLVEPQVLTPLRTEEGKELRKQGIEKFSNRALYPREDGVCNTITSVQKDNLLQEPSTLPLNYFDENGKKRSLQDRIYDSSGLSTAITTSFHPNIAEHIEGTEYKGKFIKEGDGLYTDTTQEFFRGGLDGVSRTLKAETHDAATCIKEGARYRIRKLTEREVFRLMDVSEEDIDKIQAAGISKTAMYKLAGNSIVVSCLYHIFRKMFIEPGCEEQQLSLF